MYEFICIKTYLYTHSYIHTFLLGAAHTRSYTTLIAPALRNEGKSLFWTPRDRVHRMKLNSYMCCALPLAPILFNNPNIFIYIYIYLWIHIYFFAYKCVYTCIHIYLCIYMDMKLNSNICCALCIPLYLEILKKWIYK
jgi:hypothetical protein